MPLHPISAVSPLPLPQRLPETIVNALQRFIDEIKKESGDNLLSILLYGSAARNDFNPTISDINLLIVLRDARVVDLSGMAEAVRKIRRKFKVSPRFMSLDALRSAADVMPAAYLDMKSHYRLLYGDDILGDMSVNCRHLLLQNRYQARMFLMRLRNIYLSPNMRAKNIEAALKFLFSQFLHLLRNMYAVDGRPAPEHFAVVIQESPEVYGLDGGVLNALFALKMKQRHFRKKELAALLEAFMDLLYDFIQYTDGLDSKAEVPGP